MKIRRSFVSNSSSCSFVTIGFELEGDIDKGRILADIFAITADEIAKSMLEGDIDDLFYEVLNDSDYQFLNDNEIEGKIIFGKELVTFIDDGYEDISGEIDFEEEAKELNDVKKHFESDSKIKLYYGVRDN